MKAQWKWVGLPIILHHFRTPINTGVCKVALLQVGQLAAHFHDHYFELREVLAAGDLVALALGGSRSPAFIDTQLERWLRSSRRLDDSALHVSVVPASTGACTGNRPAVRFRAARGSLHGSPDRAGASYHHVNPR